MGLQQNLNNIQTNLLQAKTALAQSISNKGVECSADEALSTYASKIDSITTGSTGGTGEKFVVPNGLKFGYSKAFDPTLYDTSNVTDMSYMFYRCSELTSIDLSGWNTTNVTTISNMFDSCTKLTTLDLSNFDTSKVLYMNHVFYNCTNLTTLDLSNFDTSNVTGLGYMFGNCTKLTTLDLSNFDTLNVTGLTYMFNSCSGLTTLNLSSFNLLNVLHMDRMFWNCTSLTNLQLNDLGHKQSCTSLDLSTCTALTKDSILFLFNNAFDRATAGYTTAFTITLNAATKALLSDDELAIATNKGFTVV